MLIDSLQYNGACSCGREHTMVTRVAVIESGCLFRFEKWMEEYGITGKRCALYGEHSYAATVDRHPEAEQEIILDPNGLHADERSTALVLEKLEDDVEVLIAVGSGTIHDIARFCAHERGIRFVSCPTAASVDGFCSTVAAMTWYGYKKTLPAVAPELVLADTEVIRHAPMELVRSGVGDIMAKYTARADWEIAHLLTGEYLCPRIRDIMAEAADTVMASIPGILSGSEEAYAHVTYALIMSGIAMQMMGNSRPASGAEHHISHMIEMQPAAFRVRFPALHGEKTGVGSILAAREYERLARIEDISPVLTDYAPVPDETLRAFFGEDLFRAISEENRKDCLAAVSKERLAKCWPEIRQIIDAMPKAEAFDSTLRQLGAKHTLEEIGVASEDLSILLKYSPLVRNRLTLMRIRRMIKGD
ncbi:MAG: sn-glycerol-1-phosphate dehydrogenase [Oscillospiraceae bacterium]|nr:sn-glycerol-1-phosphate dehydrogenase [Oscillospiraceae bacterium]